MNNYENWGNIHGSKSWENLGRLQTQQFAVNAVNSIPPNLASQMRGMSICDVGCAMGDALPVLRTLVGEKNEIVGVDFSTGAIASAVLYYPNFKFLCSKEIEKEYDIIYSSNVLEHLEDPMNLVKHMASKSNKFVIILVPFQETLSQLVPEHVTSFDYDTLPNIVGNHKLIYKYTFNTNPKGIWPYGQQLLLIYAKEST